MIEFKVDVPNELYIDNFSEGKTATFNYEGPTTFDVLVDKATGMFCDIVSEQDQKYNHDTLDKIAVDATKTPDVAEFIYSQSVEHQHEFVDETLVDGSIYKQISNPRLRDYYSYIYNFETSSWEKTLIVRNPASLRNITAARYREFIEENRSSVPKTNKTLLAQIDAYLATLNEFESTGKGSIPSWKIIEPKISDVPMIPSEILNAFNKLP